LRHDVDFDGDADDVDVDGCPLVPPPIFRCLLFYEKSRGNSV